MKNLILLLAYLFILSFTIISKCESYSDFKSTYKKLFFSDFGYTLIGEKAVSIEDYIDDDELYRNSDTLNQFLENLRDTFNGSKNILSKIHHSLDLYLIEIIHLRKLREVIHENPELRQFIHEKYGTTKTFLKKLRKSETSICEMLMNAAYFKGIVLGYGQSNSQYFCRRCELARHLKKFPFTRLFPYFNGISITRPNFPKKIIKPYKIHPPELNSQFTSFEEEWKWIQDVM